MADAEQAPGPITRRYRDKVARDNLAEDAAQRGAAQALDRVRARLEAGSRRTGFFDKLLGRAVPPAKGLYLWGDVGRGKTMLMDLFFETVDEPRKTRVHFHEFMNTVHGEIAAFRDNNPGTKGARDPVPAVAGPIAENSRLLCFDEFVVSDITDAMLLKRLFEVLFDKGVTVVATSNIAPEKLYWNGLNRQLFTPFIDLLEAHAEVYNLDAKTDYRRMRTDAEDVYRFGPPNATEPEMDALFGALSDGAKAQAGSIKSLGRTIPVPQQAGGVARFSFQDLCGKPLGARDYLKIANAFETVMIEGVPVFSKLRSDASKRFITLIDTLYDRGVKLAASFEAPLEELAQDEQTRFEFSRCLSRLEEMRSAHYIAKAARAPSG